MDQWTLQPCRARIRRNPLASSLYIPMVPILTVTGEKGEGRNLSLFAQHWCRIWIFHGLDFHSRRQEK